MTNVITLFICPNIVTTDSLAGHRYVLREDHPYCIKCYENVFANTCDECGKIIGIDSKVRQSDRQSRYQTGRKQSMRLSP